MRLLNGFLINRGYNTDTVHLQGALIHTLLYMFYYNTDTVHLQADYNSDTLQDALINSQYRYSTLQGALYIFFFSHTHTRAILIFLII